MLPDSRALPGLLCSRRARNHQAYDKGLSSKGFMLKKHLPVGLTLPALCLSCAASGMNWARMGRTCEQSRCKRAVQANQPEAESLTWHSLLFLLLATRYVLQETAGRHACLKKLRNVSEAGAHTSRVFNLPVFGSIQIASPCFACIARVRNLSCECSCSRRPDGPICSPPNTECCDASRHAGIPLVLRPN